MCFLFVVVDFKEDGDVCFCKLAFLVLLVGEPLENPGLRFKVWLITSAKITLHLFLGMTTLMMLTRWLTGLNLQCNVFFSYFSQGAYIYQSLVRVGEVSDPYEVR